MPAHSEKRRIGQPSLLLADPKGRVFDYPFLECVGKSGSHFTAVEQWIPLPDGSKLFTLPERSAVGWDPDAQQLRGVVDVWQGDYTPVPVAAFLPPGYVRTHLPGTELAEHSPLLPTWAYTCVAWHEGQFVAAAFRIDANAKWQPERYDDRELLPRIEQRLAELPRNRLLKHLAHCAAVYHCFAAKNLFLDRWEAPLPVASRCNAACLGCLSWQPKGRHVSSHHRIRFRPSVKEICEIAVRHLEVAPEAMVSFGQGCEGEPILEHELIGEAIAAIRSETKRGTIHLNTNGSLPKEIEGLVKRGLDSVRISLNSCLPERYHAYFTPQDYSFLDVKRSAILARQAGAYLHFNLLVFPGISDQQQEIDALMEWIEATGVNHLQLKNLCIDPDAYVAAVSDSHDRGEGMRHLVKVLRTGASDVTLGYFNIPKEEFGLPRISAKKKAVARVGETP